MKQSVRLLAFVAAVALITSAARADGYWPQSTARAQGPLPWTGPYFGLNLGYAWHDIAGIYDSAGTPTDLSGTEPNGAIVGAQLGYNWRMNWFLLGVELDADAGTNSKSVVDPANSEQITGDLSSLASARARLGVLWYDVLFYGTGGVGAPSGWSPTACRCAPSTCATSWATTPLLPASPVPAPATSSDSTTSTSFVRA